MSYESCVLSLESCHCQAAHTLHSQSYMPQTLIAGTAVSSFNVIQCEFPHEFNLIFILSFDVSFQCEIQCDVSANFNVSVTVMST